MTDRIFLTLNDKFALGYDDLQWILFRAHRRHDRVTWDGISFVRSTKAILERCIEECGCKPTVQAQDAIDRMPWSFDVWKAAYRPNAAV
jgi:hypothetical protein